MACLNGMQIRVVPDEHRCTPGPSVRRTWKERLFSRPWHPRRRYNPGPLIQPKDVLIAEGVMFVTQAQLNALKEDLIPSRFDKFNG